MPRTIPTKVPVLIVARRLNGTVQSSGALVGFPAEITYDVASIDPDYVLNMTNKLPADRVVSPMGDQVRVQAASHLSEATVEVLGSETRLFVREGIVFGPCVSGIR